jgi:predicted Ser/Thr protein kinase
MTPRLCLDCRSPLPDAAARDVCDACTTVRSTVASKKCIDCGATLPPGSTREICEGCVTMRNTVVSSPPPAAKPKGPAIPALADYEILGEVARGGAGVIYRARQRSLNRTVALKMILSGEFASADAVQRFRVEAEAAASLDHPNIVPIYQIGEENGQHFFSMKLVEGEILSRRIRENPLSPRESARLVATVARAIHYGHQRGILHRDLKPSNILVTPDATPYVVDFGLAKRVDAEEALTKTGDIMGTPSYMAPEQMEGRSTFTTAVDVYGLGGILYELLTGQPPFRGDTMASIMRKVLEEEPASPRSLNAQIDPDLETISLKCLEKSPGKRYGTADQLAEDLERWLAGEPIHARPVTTWTRGLKWARRRPAAAALIGVSLLALVTVAVGGLLFSVSTERARREAVEAEHEFELALTRDVAGRLESDLQRVALLPTMLADALTHKDRWTQEELTQWGLDLLKRDPRIYGLTFAFEPKQFDPSRDDYCLYVSRKTDPPSGQVLLPPGYKLYREWDWYNLPLNKGTGIWDGPYVDVGASDLAIVTHSVPILRNGKAVGVVGVDLSSAYFRVIRQWLDELNLRSAYCFVLGDDDEFVSHPDARYQSPKTMLDVPGMEELKRLIKSRKTGFVEEPDFRTRQWSRFCVAPVASADWTVVIVLPKSSGGP